MSWKACGCASGTPTGSGWESGRPLAGDAGARAAVVREAHRRGEMMWWAAWKNCGRGQLRRWGASWKIWRKAGTWIENGSGEGGVFPMATVIRDRPPWHHRKRLFSLEPRCRSVDQPAPELHDPLVLQ